MFDWTLNQFGPDPWSEKRTSNFMIGQHVIFSISYNFYIGCGRKGITPVGEVFAD